jgi:hypothetical protein
MAISQKVQDSLKEAEGNLRNALVYAARNEKPYISKHIADMIVGIESLSKTEQLLDKLENRKIGDDGMWNFFNIEE